MHYFWYQNKNHLTKHFWSNRRPNLSSTRGQFILDDLRRGMKEKFKIFGYGDHPFHKVLSSLPDYPHKFSNVLRGHVIQIEDPATAMWLKLNHDLIIRPGMTYGGHFADLDLEYVTRAANQLREMLTRTKEMEEFLLRSKQTSSLMRNMLTNKAAKLIGESLLNDLNNTYDSLNSSLGVIQKSTLEITNETKQLNDDLFQYFVDKKAVQAR